LDKNKKNKIESILLRDRSYSVQNGTYCFLPGDRKPQKTAGQGLLASIQGIFKKSGKIYYLLLYTFAPVLPSRQFRKHLKSVLDSHDRNTTILNLGSGPHCIHGRKDIINIDLYAFDEVDIVSDATKLPLKNDCVDLIISIAMMEHLEAPDKIVEEMHRVLKKGGQFVCYLPFIAPFHAAPYDFHRWSAKGAKHCFAIYEQVDTEIGAGPTSGMLWVLQEWLAIFFSLGSRTLHDMVFILLMLITAPIKLLDLFLIHFPNAERIASGFFISGKK